MIRFSTAGESHGEALIALISGLPAGVPVDLDFVNRELWRRQQGYGRGGRMKIETDKAHVLSGVRHGKTIGSPVSIEIVNRDWKNWEEKAARCGRRPSQAPGGCLASARPRRPGRRIKVQLSRRTLCFGARLGPRVDRPRRRRRLCQADAAGSGD